MISFAHLPFATLYQHDSHVYANHGIKRYLAYLRLFIGTNFKSSGPV